MSERMKQSGCGYYPDPDSNYEKDRECNIKSICCEDFVKEEFSLETVATTTSAVIVYQSTNGNITRGTIKVINLSSQFSINFTVNNNTNIIVGPRQEAAITAENLATVTVQSRGQDSARVKLCFDLQVRSLEIA